MGLIQKSWYIADMDTGSKVQRFERRPFVGEKHEPSVQYTLKTLDLELFSVTKAVVLFASVKPDKSHQFL